MSGIPVEQLRAMIRFLGPSEITPDAKRYLESLCDQHDAPESADVRCSECGQPASTPTAHQGSASGHGTWWECPRQFTDVRMSETKGQADA